MIYGCVVSTSLSLLSSLSVSVYNFSGKRREREKERMGEVAVSSMVGSSCGHNHNHNHNHNRFFGSPYSGGEWKKRNQSCSKWQWRLLIDRKSRPLNLIITNQMGGTPSTYSSSITTDILLYEAPGASFDEYLEDKPRVFKAIFPDKRRSQQLNQEEWRIQMLPIQFLFLTAWPVIDMRLRCKTEGKDYPPGVPCDITKVLELDIIRWQLEGLDLKPSHFTIGVKGAMYSDRRGIRSRLKGQLQLSISFVLPSMLELVPEQVRGDVADSVLKGLLENMKHRVNGSLLADYSKFKREKSKKLV